MQQLHAAVAAQLDLSSIQGTDPQTMDRLCSVLAADSKQPASSEVQLGMLRLAALEQFVPQAPRSAQEAAATVERVRHELLDKIIGMGSTKQDPNKDSGLIQQ